MAAAPPRSHLSVTLMRRLDAWAGVPICFLLTIVQRVKGWFSRAEADAGTPRQVLLVELAEMGTTVLACPAMQELQARYPGCAIHFLLFRHIQDSVRVLGLIPDDRIVTIDARSPWTLFRDTWRFMRTARRWRIDTTINLEMFARFSTILTWLSGARRRVGFHPFHQPGLYAGDLYTHRVAYNPHIHTSQSLVTLVHAIDQRAGGEPLGKFPTPASRYVPRVLTDAPGQQKIWKLLTSLRPEVHGKRLIVVNPNASKLLTLRKWPLDRYASLVARLVDDPQNACVITGLASEKDDARYITERVPGERVVDLAGKTSLRDLIDLFNIAQVLVTNDSGPAHFAALTGIHVFVFFGPETPILYRPLTDHCTPLYAGYACSPCVSAYNQRLSACTDNRCLQHIDVDTVHRQICGILH